MSKPFTEGSYVHAIKRGGRGMPIVKDDADRYRFLKCLYFLNDANHPTPWERDVNEISNDLHFQRPDAWGGKRKPLTKIHAYCLVDNHFHVLLQEVDDGGISQFMHDLSSSMTHHFNQRYDAEGSIFSGPPTYRVINDDSYLTNARLYIAVKNAMEMYQGGLEAAFENLGAAYEFALSYPFCSLADHVGKRDSPIITKAAVSTHSPDEYKKLARDFMRGGAYRYGDGDSW